MGALSATGQPKYHEGFTYGGRMVEGFANFIFNDSKSLERAFRKYNKTPVWDKVRGRKRRVVGIMVEALQGEGGIRPGTVEFFKNAREVRENLTATSRHTPLFVLVLLFSPSFSHTHPIIFSSSFSFVTEATPS